MRVRTLIRFNDLKENKVREENSEFEASKERVEHINSTSYGVLVEVVKEEKKETVKEVAAKTKTAKKK